MAQQNEQRRTRDNTLRPVEIPSDATPVKIYGRMVGTIRDYEEFPVLDRIRNFNYSKFSADQTKKIRRKIICCLVKVSPELKNFANNNYNSEIAIVSDSQENGRNLLLGLKSNTMQSLCLQIYDAVDDFGKIYNYAKVFLVERSALWVMQQMRINNFSVCTEEPSKEWIEETEKAKEMHRKEKEESKK